MGSSSETIERGEWPMNAASWRLAMVLALLSGTSGWAGPIRIIGNETSVNDGAFSAVASLGGTYAKAVGFTMPAETFTLDSIVLRLKEQAGSDSTLLVGLFGGGGAGPAGPALVDFLTPALPTVAANVTLLPTSAFLLKPNTTYWLEVTGTSSTLNGIVWYANTPGIAPTGIATDAGARFASQSVPLGGMASSSVLNTYEVFGTLDSPAIVPEPMGLIQAAVALAAGLAYAGWRRWRRPGTGPGTVLPTSPV
jgi:hypothetical protein